jgi:alpha-1,2-mannosyltransferase
MTDGGGGSVPLPAGASTQGVGRGRWYALCVGVGLVAVTARLLPVLRGGGLFGIGHYDAAVYFGSAVGLVHGRLPYRDFLLLHPPGIAVVLAPFGVLAGWVGDPTAMALARVAWIGLGALNAILAARVLRTVGLVPALLAGLCYAVFYPAVAIEQTTRQEAVTATCLLAALALLSVASPNSQLSRRAVLIAGACLGFALSVKIWIVMPLLIVIGYLAVKAGARQAARCAVAAAVGVAVCLPFLLAAPERMWRYVVVDQLERSGTPRPMTQRLSEMAGFGLVDHRLGPWLPEVIVVAFGVATIAAALAFQVRQARLAVILLFAFGVLLVATPSWFPHYAGLPAGTVAITCGAAAHTLSGWPPPSRIRAGLVVSACLVALLASVAHLTRAEFGTPFPGRQMASAVAPLPGCITADDPSTLIAMNVLTRNVRRGCPLVVDLGGYSYDLRPPGRWPVPRAQNPLWQRHALDHLKTGSATIVVRYSTRFGLSDATAREIARWPVIHRIGQYRLRQPIP